MVWNFVDKPLADGEVPLVFLMESAGVYYQGLAHHLYGIGKVVHVVLPNTSSHYAKSLNMKTKTDAADARVLARFALERTHRVWHPSSPLLTELHNLARYHVQL